MSCGCCQDRNFPHQIDDGRNIESDSDEAISSTHRPPTIPVRLRTLSCRNITASCVIIRIRRHSWQHLRFRPSINPPAVQSERSKTNFLLQTRWVKENREGLMRLASCSTTFVSTRGPIWTTRRDIWAPRSSHHHSEYVHTMNKGRFEDRKRGQSQSKKIGITEHGTILAYEASADNGINRVHHTPKALFSKKSASRPSSQILPSESACVCSSSRTARRSLRSVRVQIWCSDTFFTSNYNRKTSFDPASTHH